MREGERRREENRREQAGKVTQAGSTTEEGRRNKHTNCAELTFARPIVYIHVGCLRVSTSPSQSIF
jgi:hypothetical protein